MSANPDLGTWGRYKEIPLDKITPDQKRIYQFTMKKRRSVLSACIGAHPSLPRGRGPDGITAPLSPCLRASRSAVVHLYPLPAQRALSYAKLRALLRRHGTEVPSVALRRQPRRYRNAQGTGGYLFRASGHAHPQSRYGEVGSDSPALISSLSVLARACVS